MKNVKIQQISVLAILGFNFRAMPATLLTVPLCYPLAGLSGSAYSRAVNRKTATRISF